MSETPTPKTAPPVAKRPGLTLVGFLLAIAVMFGIMAVNGTWLPRLGLDLRGGTTITLTASAGPDGAVSQEALEQAQDIIRQRVDSLGVGEVEVTTLGSNQIQVSMPGGDTDEMLRLVGQTAQLGFRPVYSMDYAAQPTEPVPSSDPSPAPTGEPSPGASVSPAPESPQASAPQTSAPGTEGNGRPALPAALPTNPAPEPTPTTPPEDYTPAPRPTEVGQGTPAEQAMDWQPSQEDLLDFQMYTCDQDFPDVADQPLISCDPTGQIKYLLGPTVIPGTMVTDASSGIPQGQLNYVVNLEFNAEGAERFAEVTGRLAQNPPPQNQFAIVLDGVTISAPSVSQSIVGGRATIDGSGINQQTSEELARVLRYGALPLEFEQSGVDTVSPTLGGEQLRAGLIAGAIGMILVAAYCLLYYRLLAFVVIATLVVAAAMTYAVMVLLGASAGFALSLPGIAGAIIAIGTTADSFIIYFERIRDEAREGRTLRSAVELGWRNARRTVVIADVVSLLSAVVLFFLAIASVRGFAFTLGLTTLIDLAVVFFFTKPLMSVLARTEYFGWGHKWSGLDRERLGAAAVGARDPEKVKARKKARAERLKAEKLARKEERAAARREAKEQRARDKAIARGEDPDDLDLDEIEDEDLDEADVEDDELDDDDLEGDNLDEDELDDDEDDLDEDEDLEADEFDESDDDDPEDDELEDDELDDADELDEDDDRDEPKGGRA